PDPLVRARCNNLLIVIRGKVLGWRVGIVARVRGAYGGCEFHVPRGTAWKRCRTRSGNWRQVWRSVAVNKVGGVRQPHAESEATARRTIDVLSAPAANPTLGGALGGLEGRSWRRKDGVRTLTLILTICGAVNPLTERRPWLTLALLFLFVQGCKAFAVGICYLAHVQSDREHSGGRIVIARAKTRNRPGPGLRDLVFARKVHASQPHIVGDVVIIEL